MSVTRDTEYTIMRLSGMSTDDKPTDVKSGSWFREIDTSKEYMFDGANWVEQSTGGGGGGGGAMVVNGSFDDSHNIVLDKTFAEIVAAAPNVIIALTDTAIGVEYYRPDLVDIDSGVAMFDNYQLEADGNGGFDSMSVKQLYLYESGDIQFSVGSITIS